MTEHETSFDFIKIICIQSVYLTQTSKAQTTPNKIRFLLSLDEMKDEICFATRLDYLGSSLQVTLNH